MYFLRKTVLCVIGPVFCLNVHHALGQNIADSWEALPDKETLIRQSMQYLCEESYDSVFVLSKTLCQLYPEEPTGYLIAAHAYQSMMRAYRVRTFEVQFDSLIEITLEKAKKAVKSNPCAENYFVLGVAEGYSSFHNFRRGDWIKAVRTAVICNRSFKKARRHDRDFVDTLFGIAVYEYGKGKALNMGLGLFSSSREEIISMLETVVADGIYMSNDALFMLQLIYFEVEEYAKAMELNNKLYQKFPRNLSCLYDRALLLEKQDRLSEAVLTWRKLITRIQASGQPSNGYLAECHYRLSRLYRQLEDPKKSAEELKSALLFAKRYNKEMEIDGPYTGFSEIRKSIEDEMKNLH